MNEQSRRAAQLAEQVLGGLAAIGLVLRGATRQSHQPLKLTPTQGRVLMLLLRCGARGARLGEVAQALGVSAPTASDTVAALVRRKLVARRNETADRRALSLVLTAAGARAAAATTDWPTPLLAAAGALDEDQRHALLDGVVALLRDFERRGLLPVATLCPACAHFVPNAHPGPAKPHHCDYLAIDIAAGDVRIDCAAHLRADATRRKRNWNAYDAGDRQRSHKGGNR